MDDDLELSDRVFDWVEKKTDSISTSRIWDFSTEVDIMDSSNSSRIEEKLELRGHLSNFGSGYKLGISLMHPKGMIERWDNTTMHRTNEGVQIGSPHKHYVVDGYDDTKVFIPDDVDLSKDIPGIISDILKD